MFSQITTSSWPPADTDFDFTCPSGGDFYICATSWIQFFGCCTTDPCASGYGCPDEDLRSTSFNKSAYSLILPQECENDDPAQWWTCPALEVPFIGCCSINACVNEGGCPAANLSQAKLNTDESFLTGLLSPVSVKGIESQPWHADRHHTGLLGYGPVLGICLALILMVTFTSVYLVLKAFPHRFPPSIRNSVLYQKLASERYRPVPIPTPELDIGGDEPCSHSNQGSQDVPGAKSTRLGEPRVVRRRDFAWASEIVWDFVLTVLPLLFIVLAILALHLEGQTASTYGDSVIEVIRISPTAYPIVFAAVAARFYRNLSRWALERPQGIKLAALEQLSGSQSFAGALERLLFVRAHIMIGSVILLTWVLSPLGGQSASRILYDGMSRLSSSGTVSFVDPARQFSHFMVSAMAEASKTNVFSVYTTLLMATAQQRRSPRDIWALPRIPQWPPGTDSATVHTIDTEALAHGQADYASLLGIKIQGLDFESRGAGYEFTVETSYFDLDCSNLDSPGREDLDRASLSSSTQGRDGDVQKLIDELKENYERVSLATQLTAYPLSRANTTGKDTSYHLLLASVATEFDSLQKQFNPSHLSIFNCTIGSKTLQTDIRCRTPSMCSAWRQHLLERPEGRGDPMEAIRENLAGFKNGTRVWPKASGDNIDGNTSTATENFLAGHTYLYASAGRNEFVDVDLPQFSRRLTTLFNTFWDATKNPIGYPSLDMEKDRSSARDTIVESPYDIPELFSPANATARANNVYRVDRVWLAVLLTATVVLQVLAIVGALLLLFIKGPDILGFASTMTRDNTHVPLPPGGSALDGPERARMLRDLRVQLADLRPTDDQGYIAVASVPSLKGSEKQDHWPDGTMEDTAYYGRVDNISVQTSGSKNRASTQEDQKTGPEYRKLNRNRMYI